MANFSKVQMLTLNSRVEQLRNICDDFLKNESDEFYSKEDKIFGICCSAKDALDQTNIKFKQ